MKTPKSSKKKQSKDFHNAIVYDAFEKKNAIEVKLRQELTPQESLIHTLNLMDFMAVFQDKRIPQQNDQIQWIVLERSEK
jgi:hypothetical protein